MIWKKLSFENKISLFFIIFILFSIPMTLALLLQTTFFLSRAQIVKTNEDLFKLFPIIVTDKFPEGKVGENYSASVKGYMSDASGNLKIIGLPSGLVYGNCYKGFDPQVVKYFVNCEIFGTPVIEGNYWVTVYIGGGGLTNSKELRMIIASENI